MEVLGPLFFKSVGGYGETALLHKPTGTLLVTDAVVRVPDGKFKKLFFLAVVFYVTWSGVLDNPYLLPS